MRKGLGLWSFVLVMMITSLIIVSSASDSQKTIGESEAKLSMEVYTDFADPFSAKWYKETFPSLRKEYIVQNNLKIVFRHYPPEQIHSDAMDRAKAAECAAEQGVFLEFINDFYNNLDVDTDIDYYNALVGRLGVTFDFNKFESCFSNAQTATTIKNDLVKGVDKGAGGTPYFFIKGRVIAGAQERAEFNKIIDSLLSQTKPLPRTCLVPQCEGAWDTGKKDDYNCPIYSCMTRLPHACVTPKCDGRIVTDEYDENGCKIYACPTTPAEKIGERVTCFFEGSQKEEKCYPALENQKGEGSWCTGANNCDLYFTHYKGERITWKSTCGGYQYTTQDGNEEKIVFNCKSGETKPIEVYDHSYTSSYYRCYDGRETKESSEQCLSFKEWRSKAATFCKQDECPIVDFRNPKETTIREERCGVESFSVIGECVNIQPTPIDSSTGEGSSGDNSDDKLTICKDSCSLDSKCYPFGYRKSGNYCSDLGAFTKQLGEEEMCENNFECGSNVCVSGQCVSQGLMNKIINWFKNIFN